MWPTAWSRIFLNSLPVIIYDQRTALFCSNHIWPEVVFDCSVYRKRKSTRIVHICFVELLYFFCPCFCSWTVDQRFCSLRFFCCLLERSYFFVKIFALSLLSAGCISWLFLFLCIRSGFSRMFFCYCCIFVGDNPFQLSLCNWPNSFCMPLIHSTIIRSWIRYCYTTLWFIILYYKAPS